MKKNIFKILMLSLVVIFATSCENQENTRFLEEPEYGWVQFPAESTTISVNNQTTEIPVRVDFTAPVNASNLSINYSISSVVGAANDAISATGTVNIIADTNQAWITLNVLPTAAAALLVSDISLDIILESASRGVSVGLSDNSVTTTHRVNLVCDVQLDLGGMYSVETTYGFHDFLPSFATNTMVMEIRDNGDGTFFIQDFSGGLYDGGPYTSAYGTGPTSFDFTFSNACKQIVWENQSDQWGAVVPLEGGKNEYDPGTGVIITSWFCEAYGENGISIYTPI